MECGLCGTVNRATARFCGGCGSPLARVCPGCKAEIDGSLRFCDQCGTALDATPAAATPPPTTAPSVSGAVRKTVTVLFADLGGSTGFGERTDPEVSRQVLARYHALLQESIDAHGGTVAKFMGDGMMATFGIPEIAEDDARRAVLAGVEIQRRFESFATDVRSRYGETLTLRVGINTGEVVIAAGDADLVGDALNVAARLEKACRPGHVLVGDETWRITRGDLAYEPLGEVIVAGRAGPVGTYEVVATGATTAEPVAPFVGRVGETARLLAAFDQARTEATAVLVTVLGSPGMGKTRLSRELAATLDADERASTYEIRCDRSGGATFAPFADLIGTAAGVGDETDDGVDARERIAALVADEADRARVVDVVAGLLGAAPARSVEETFWAIRRIVESLATARPLMVVIDDIQWAEPKLLDLLEHLAEWIRGAAVLLVCLARPELRDLRPALTEPGRRVADVVALDGLDASATAELAAGLLGSALPAELVDRLPTSTDGNPLFVRELVRMLVDDAVVRSRDDGTWELAIDAEAIEVPPTIQSLLATRVERLPAEELRILELASVVGAEFSVGAIRELTDAPAAVPSVLERLRRKELVEPTGSYWGDDPLHRFHHVLIRDAAYRRLLKTTRAELHRRVGQWTDSIAGDLVGEQETAIAFHYEQAHRYRRELGTTDDETDRLGRRAAELLGVAARRALDREDLTSAGALARRALAALPDADVEERADLLMIACECFLSSGDVTAGAPLVDALDTLAGDNEQLGAWAACYRAQLVGLTDPDGVVAAEEMATTAAATLERLGDGAGEAKAHQVRAGLLARLGRVGEAEVVLDLALGAARASDDRRRVTAVLGAAPQAALFGPSPVARAGGRCLDVVRLLRITTASPSVEATSMRCQAVLEALRGRFDVSRSMLASARASLEELGLRHGLLETDLFTGMVELIAGDAGAAIDPLRSAYEGLGTLGVGADAGQAAALLATALLACGETDEAELMAAESEALAGQNLKTAIAWRIARAEVHAARGELDAGTALAAEAVDIAAATDLVLDHADACVALADLRALSGDTRRAEQARLDARRLYEAKGATVPAARLAVPVPGEDVVVPLSTATRERPAGPDARTPIADNAACRFMELLRVAFNAKDRVALARLIAPDCVHDDRRSIVASVGLDPRGRLDDLEATIDQGFSFAEPVVIAVRGERLALSRMLAHTAAGDESARLSVNELDADGRMARSVLFDDEDLAGAIAELDAWYLAGEGATDATTIALGVDLFAHINAGDWDAYRDSIDPAFVGADHRELGWPTLDRAGLVEMMRGYADSQSEFFMGTQKFLVSGRCLLVVLDIRGTTLDGTTVEWAPYIVLTASDAGLMAGFDIYDEDDFTAALARFDELGTGAPDGPRIANLASSATYEFVELVDRGDLDGLRARIGDEFVRHDHRRVTGQGTVPGKDAMLDNLETLVELDAAVSVLEIVAIRGDLLALSSVRFERDGFGVETLELVGVDALGRYISMSDFDADELPAALRALDAAYFVGEGEPFQRMLRTCGKFGTVSLRDDTAELAGLVAPGFVFTDRRLLGYGDGDLQYLLDAGYTGLDRVDGSVVDRVLYLAGSALLTVQRWLAISDTGSEFEQVTCYVVHVDESALVDRLELYDEADFSTALVRLDELAAGAGSDPRSSGVENAATRADARAARFLARPDHETPDAFALADGFMLEDRRTVVALPDLDAGGLAKNFAAMRAQGYTIQPPVPLAVRGELLCVSRRVATTPRGDESPVLALTELDEQGRYRSVVFFDADDVSAAMAELDDRYLAGEGAQHARVLRVGRAFADAMDRRDFDAVRELLAADFAMSDRTRRGYGEGDREYLIAAMRTRADVAASDGATIGRLLRVEGNTSLTVAEVHHITPGGSDDAWVSCIVLQVDADDRVRRAESYEEEDFDIALARLHELGATDPRTQHAENTTTHLMARSVELATARRFDLLRELFADDFVRADHRTGVSAPVANGPDEFVTAYASWFEVGFDHLSIVPIAIRGDCIALARMEWSSADGRTVAFLGLYERNADGRVVRGSHFDEDDLAAALTELDDRFLAGEGAEHLAVLAAGQGWIDASRTQDVDALRALTAPNLVCLDHSPLGFGSLDREGLLAATQLRFELSADDLVVVRSVQVAGSVVLAVHYAETTTDDGSRYEREACYLLGVDAAGLIDRWEVFGEGDYDRALARLDELGATPREAGPVNPVTRLLAQLLDLMNRGDNAAAFALDAVASDVVRFDRRHTVAAPTVVDGVGFVENAGAIYEVFGVVRPDPIAVRGDRLALIRLHCGEPDGFPLRLLVVYELDADGRICWEADYDEEQIDEALDELDERYLAGEGAEHEYLVRRLGDFGTAQAALDWDGVEALVADDFRFVDHRPMGLPENDRAGYIGVMRASEEQTPGVRMVHRSLDVLGDLVLARTGRVGATPDGLEYEWEQIAVMVWAAGLLRRVELFPVADVGAAQARFEELAERSRIAPYVDNRLVRIGVRAQWLGRFADVRLGFYRDDCVLDDRRPGVNAGTVHGAEAVDASIQSGVDVFGVLEIDWLAVRGDRLGLNRWAFVADGGFEAPGVSVIEMDEDDLVCRVTSFQESDLATAVDVLESRHRELAGDGYRWIEHVAAAGEQALNHRDFDAFAPLLAPGFAIVDHRQLGVPMDRAAYLESLRVLIDQTPDFTFFFAKPRVEGNVAITPVPFFGTTPEGSRYEWSYVQVAVGDPDAGQATAFEFFDDDQWDEAVARFEALAVAGEPHPPSRAERATAIENAASRRTAAAAREFGMEGKGSEHHADDLVRVDHRRMIGVPTTTTRDEFADAARAFADVGMTDLTFETLAVRGDRSCLGRLTYSGGDFDVRFLTVVGCNDRHEMAWIDNFDDDDLGIAFDTLDERYIADEGADHAYIVRRVQDAAWTINRGHHDAYQALFTPECAVVNHRRLNWPMRTIADVVESEYATSGVVETYSMVFRELECAGDAVMLLQDQLMVTPEGNDYSSLAITVARLAGGRIDVLESFDPEDAAPARTRFDELAEETRTPHVDNAAVRTLVRVEWLQRAGRRDDVAQFVADDVVLVDRRPGVSAPDLVGPEAFLASVDASASVFGDIGRTDVVAGRGDRLALTRWTMVADGGFETNGYDLVEVDEDDRLCRFVTFDESQLAEAVDDLERRHGEIAGAALTSVERAVANGEHALNHRDGEALERCFAPEFTVEDHRVLRLSLNRTEYLQSLQVFQEQIPELALVFSKVHCAGHVALASVVPLTGATADGLHYEWSYLQLGRVDAAGRAVRFEFFSEDRWDDALARFDEWAAESEAPAVAPPASLAQPVSVAFAARDWEWIRGRVAPDAAVDDRRSTVSSHRVVGAEAVSALFRGFAEVGFETLDNIHVASRGDHLVLLRRVYRSAAGFELEMLAVVETDADGLMASLVLFDVDAIIPALDELEIRYSRSGRLTAHERQVILGFVAVNHRAWNELDAVLAPDVSVVDHRRLGFPAGVGKEPLIHELQSLVDQVPDVVVLIERLESAGRAVLAENHQIGTSTDGVAVDWQWHLVFSVNGDGLLELMEYFDADDQGATRARARFEELASSDA